VPILLGSAILVPLQYGNAATISVNTYVDDVANDGKCSLREAVTAVNTSAASGNTNGECAAGDGNNDTIMLSDTTYYLQIAGANEDFNAKGDLDLRASMTVAGAGIGSTVIEGYGHQDRVMQIIGPSIQVSLHDLMISGGHAPDGSEASKGAPGGGILVSNATLTLQHVELFGNLGGRGGNAFDGQFSFGGEGGAGGGLAADASVVTVSDSLLTFNHGGAGGNASEGSYMSHAGFGGDGGAISLANNSTLTLQRSILTANASGLAGLFDADADSGSGGALYLDSNSIATVTQSDIDGNAAGDTSSSAYGGGIAVLGGATLELIQSSVTRNESSLFGGGIYASLAATLLLRNDTLAENQASVGGAIFLQYTPAVIDLGTISGNTAATGSGIAILSDKDLKISNSIISGNGGGGTDCDAFSGDPNYTSAGYNLAGSGCLSDGTADIMTTDPQLGPLSANGGLGDTMMPHPTSPATDAGSCAASSVYVDERTHTRPSDVPRVANVADGCDIGAAELDDDIFWDGIEG